MSPAYSRPRGNQPATGTAVARRGAPPYGDGDDIDIYVPGGYYPWGYGGFGFGGYYGGYYDPWYGYDAYYGGQPYYANIGDGSLRLKVKPREATVYVDGYYVGRVDDFDGMFQRLHIEPGPHRIEIRADGYETLEFEVRMLPDRTTTYEGELKRRAVGDGFDRALIQRYTGIPAAMIDDARRRGSPRPSREHQGSPGRSTRRWRRSPGWRA